MKNKLYKIFGKTLATVLLSMAITACGSSADIAAQSENETTLTETVHAENIESTDIAETDNSSQDENVVTETSDIDAASGGADLIVAEAPGVGPADVSNITSVSDVPLVTLNNGVMVPQLGLGTQIQRLKAR